MNVQKNLRLIHHWLSVVVGLPLLVMIGAGLVLMLKKEVNWIQPPTIFGSAPAEFPNATFEALFSAAQGVEAANIKDWGDLDRVDIKPDKGIVKFVARNRWEVQVDTATAEVLQTAYRRSDLFEAIHDGSFFSGSVKYFIFFPSGILLFVLWATGIYLFVDMQLKQHRKRKRKAVAPVGSASRAG